MGLRTDILDSTQVIETIARLNLRIADRFPESGLLSVGQTLHEVATETDLTIVWIERPNYVIRGISYSIIAMMVLVLVLLFANLDFKTTATVANAVNLAEAATNEIILVGAAIAFLITFETRQKRKRVIAAVAQLRSVAHVIDAHQLTKDPTAEDPTEHSPKRSLTPDELKRYLNYCSEMLALTSKVAFLYVQTFHDPDAENAVHDLETLTLGLSSKIWQKMLLLQGKEAL